jgi:serine/threonine-protein kinase
MMTADDDADGHPATVAAGNDETTVVPPPTEAAPDLAWSSEDETEVIQRQSWSLTWGRAAVLLACTGVVALAVGLGGWALVGMHNAELPRPVTNPPTSWAAPPPPAWMRATPTPEPPTAAATTAQLSIASMPGTDDLGWTAYSHARCDSGTRPAVMGRTTLSVLVVCQIQPGSFYYRGVRLSDGAGIELPNAVRSSGGFDVTNPVDGTRYQVRQTGISITSPDGQVYPEPMIEYWAS